MLSTTVSVPPIVPVPSTVAMLLVRLAAAGPRVQRHRTRKGVRLRQRQCTCPGRRERRRAADRQYTRLGDRRVRRAVDDRQIAADARGRQRRAPAFVRLALPLAPVVESVTAPVRAFAEVSVIVALHADVVNDDVPVTVRAPLWVRFPVLSTTVSVSTNRRSPRTVAIIVRQADCAGTRRDECYRAAQRVTRIRQCDRRRRSRSR